MHFLGMQNSNQNHPLSKDFKITKLKSGWHDGSLVSHLLCTQQTRIQILAFLNEKRFYNFSDSDLMCMLNDIIQKPQLCSIFNGVVISRSFD